MATTVLSARPMSAILARLTMSRARSASRRSLRACIRANPYAIAGYVCRFETISRNGGTGEFETIAPGAFRQALAENQWFAQVNHNRHAPMLARTSERTLLLEEDHLGLWGELCLYGAGGDRVFDVVGRGDCKMSFEWWSTNSACYVYHGIRTFTRLDAAEISLIPPPAQPRFAGTWILPMARALAERARLGGGRA